MHDVIMINDCFVYCYHTHFATQNGQTPLLGALLEGHVAIVILLLEKRAGVNICDKVRNATQIQCLLNSQHPFTVRVTVR